MATATGTEQTHVVYITIPVEVPELPDFDSLPDEDGENLESNWHRLAMNLLIELVHWLFQGRSDFYCGGNMFIYYTVEQFKGLRVRGPDFFFVKGVEREPDRRKWIVMKEGGKYPDVIIELLSPTTAKEDLTTKKTLYDRTFRTHEYYCYDPETHELLGWRQSNGSYESIAPNERGWLWCQVLNVWLGTWAGTHPGTEVEAIWPRFYSPDGGLVPSFAEAERQRADTAEAEVARLNALLLDKGPQPRPNGGDAGQPAS